MDYRIFNVRADAIAHVRESALKVDSGRKISCLTHWGVEPASAACRFDALTTELRPHFSAFPIQVKFVIFCPDPTSVNVCHEQESNFDELYFALTRYPAWLTGRYISVY